MPKADFVLVIIMSDACGHCKVFKANQMDNLKKRLAKEFDNVALEEITLPSFSSPLPSRYPSSLQGLIGWFPMFMLFEGDDWYEAMKNKRKQLSRFIVFNGVMNNGKPQHQSKHSLNVENILNWMETGN
jgi:hypothetical protein